MAVLEIKIIDARGFIVNKPTCPVNKHLLTILIFCFHSRLYLRFIMTPIQDK